MTSVGVEPKDDDELRSVIVNPCSVLKIAAWIYESSNSIRPQRLQFSCTIYKSLKTITTRSATMKSNRLEVEAIDKKGHEQ